MKEQKVHWQEKPDGFTGCGQKRDRSWKGRPRNWAVTNIPALVSCGTCLRRMPKQTATPEAK